MPMVYADMICPNCKEKIDFIIGKIPPNEKELKEGVARGTCPKCDIPVKIFLNYESAFKHLMEE